MSAYEYYIAAQEEPQLSEDLLRHHKRVSWESNRADIARERQRAAQDQEREKAYQAHIANNKGEEEYGL